MKAWQETEASFGADPVVVLVSTDTAGALQNPDTVKRMVAFESTLAALPNVAVVYGPGTTLNQIATQLNELLLSVTARRDGLRADAVEAAKAAGKSDAEADAAGRAAVAAYEQRYGGLVAAGLPLGLPSLSNPTFDRTVFFDREGRTKPQLRWIVPDDHHAAVYVRPAEGLDQSSTDRLVSAVRAEARRVWVDEQPPPGPTAHRTSVTVTGAPVLVTALGAEVRRELPRLALVALIAVALAFALMHRPGATRWFERRPADSPARWSGEAHAVGGADARRGRVRRTARWIAPLVLGPAATAVVLGFFGLRGAPLSLGMLAFLPVMLGVGSDMPIQAAYPGRRRKGRSSRSGSAVMSRPSNSTFPAVGSTSRSMARPKVVFPLPLSPTSPSVSPARTSRLTPSTALTTAFPPPIPRRIGK